VLGLGESCNHEATKQGLSEVEITSFVPEAVAANPCARCDKHRRDIDKLNTEIADLKKKAVIHNVVMTNIILTHICSDHILY
jgi:hypothetical protein